MQERKSRSRNSRRLTLAPPLFYGSAYSNKLNIARLKLLKEQDEALKVGVRKQFSKHQSKAPKLPSLTPPSLPVPALGPHGEGQGRAGQRLQGQEKVQELAAGPAGAGAVPHARV